MTTSATLIEHTKCAETGARCATFLATFPRPYLAEINTHRNMAKNSESSRAIPPEQKIKYVIEHPYIPEFRFRTTGMGAGDVLPAEAQDAARLRWMRSRNDAAACASDLIALGVDKSRINRVLEPYSYHTAVLTATNWGNFLALRCPPGEPDVEFPAQLEFQQLAVLIRDLLKTSVPRPLEVGDWHLPFVSTAERIANVGNELYLANLSAGRNARVSYAKHADDESLERTLARAVMLADSGHLSPLEHPSQAMPTKHERHGCMSGYKPLRCMLPGEHNAALKRPDLAWLNEE